MTMSVNVLTNNIEVTIAECWLVNEEGIFFLILLEKQNYLVAIGSQVA